MRARNRIAAIASWVIFRLARPLSHRRRMVMIGKVTSLADAEKASDAFELLFPDLGVELALGGEPERLHLVSKQLADWHHGDGAPAPGKDLRKEFRELVGVTHTPTWH